MAAVDRTSARSRPCSETIGLRTIMTICAIALVDAMPADRTSRGTALNDTAQEFGVSIGTL